MRSPTSSLKKILDPAGALVRKDAFHDLDPVVVPWVVENLEQGSDRARLGIPGTEHEGSDPCVQTRTRTHQARLQGDEELCPCKAVIARCASRLTKRQDFGMGGGVSARDRLIVSSAEDLSVPDDDGPDGHLSELLRPGGLREGLQHVSLEHECVPTAPCAHGSESVLPVRRAPPWEGPWASPLCSDSLYSTRAHWGATALIFPGSMGYRLPVSTGGGV